jgi:YHS domain-containing protein
MSIKISAFISMLFLLSSCMMMGPASLSHSQMHSVNSNSSIGITDPVCGNLIESPQVELSYQYNDLTYYFHSDQCMNDFKQSPEKFINNPSSPYNHGMRNGMMWGLGAIGMAAMMLIIFL